MIKKIQYVFACFLFSISQLSSAQTLSFIPDKDLTFEETLTHDVIELMTVFCAKLYGKRSHQNKIKTT